MKWTVEEAALVTTVELVPPFVRHATEPVVAMSVVHETVSEVSRTLATRTDWMPRATGSAGETTTGPGCTGAVADGASTAGGLPLPPPPLGGAGEGRTLGTDDAGVVAVPQP